jgi:T5orf172 domain
MNAGYVYILINASMAGLIKIGRTLRDSRQRARQLHTTGVPTPFQVAFEIFSEHHEALEAAVHERLKDFRVTESREFFRYPLDKAIALLLALNTPPTRVDAVFAAEDVTDRLRKKYPGYIRPEIASVRLVQPEDRVWLEITVETEIAGYLKDQHITRTDLGFVSDGLMIPFFDPANTVSVNASRLVDDCNSYFLATATDLFTDDASHEIGDAHEETRAAMR